MGLSIHYAGSINRTEDIPPFIEELTDIAEAMDWMVQPINEGEEDPDFRGLIVNPKGDCEPLCFIFDRQGRLRALMDLVTEQVEPHEYSFLNGTKTQFAETETHVWIIGLLRYLKQRYLNNLEVEDEGGYWESEDPEKLRETKQFLRGMIEQIGGALREHQPLAKDSSTDEIITRIESIVEAWKAKPQT